MTPLARVILDLLAAESGMPPLLPDSIGQVLWCTGQGDSPERFTLAEINAAVEELIVGGQAEIVWRKGSRYYRAVPRKAVDVEQGPEAA